MSDGESTVFSENQSHKEEERYVNLIDCSISQKRSLWNQRQWNFSPCDLNLWWQLSDLTCSSTSTATEGEEHLVEFDLTNPEDVEMKLDNLTDEEMEKLLKEAYKINNELKHELSRKEREQSCRSTSAQPRQSGIYILHFILKIKDLKEH